MKKSIGLFFVLSLCLQGPNTVIAESDNPMLDENPTVEDMCRTYAMGDDIPEQEMESYIRDCIRDSMIEDTQEDFPLDEQVIDIPEDNRQWIEQPGSDSSI
ncbi:MAG: hypothetical protein HQL54_01480 [Magnetococcales bacterium]|nr:hypothetical protein [Magnetococcales bacterium]